MAQRGPAMYRFAWIVLLCLFAQPLSLVSAQGKQQRSITSINVDELPQEARQTIALIKKGGPYPYSRDGVVFGNFERLLPLHERGYYKEFTVPTPRSRDRGARRIILGKAGEFYYTDDHYKSFKRVRD